MLCSLSQSTKYNLTLKKQPCQKLPLQLEGVSQEKRKLYMDIYLFIISMIIFKSYLRWFSLNTYNSSKYVSEKKTLWIFVSGLGIVVTWPHCPCSKWECGQIGPRKIYAVVKRFVGQDIISHSKVFWCDKGITEHIYTPYHFINRTKRKKKNL